MDIYNVIVADHNEARDLMSQIMAAPKGQPRELLIAELREAILLHAKTEQATLYERLREEPSLEEKIEHVTEEHEIVEAKLNRVIGLDVEGEQWMELFGEIKADLEHHMKEEEEGLFAKAQTVIDEEEAENLGERMQELKEEALQAA